MRKIEWYDVKTKVKKLIRGFFYLYLVRQLICYIIFAYMWLVFVTSRKKFVGFEVFEGLFREKKGIILCFWHNRLVMAPFLVYLAKKKYDKSYKFMTLASRHGDGRFVGEVMQKFGFRNVFGSSNDGRKASRGIDLSALRCLIKGLKAGRGLGITPDGPRGPNQKINGEIVNMARMSGAVILPASCSYSRFIEFNSWDRFKMPLPFGRINFVCDEVFEIGQGDNDTRLEKAMNRAQKESESM